MKGVRVTTTDLETGESESVEISNDYVIVVAGRMYVDRVETYPVTGTTVLTIKREREL